VTEQVGRFALSGPARQDAGPSVRALDRRVRVRVEISWIGTCRIVGKSQPVLVMINPIVSAAAKPRVRAGGPDRQRRWRQRGAGDRRWLVRLHGKQTETQHTHTRIHTTWSPRSEALAHAPRRTADPSSSLAQLTPRSTDTSLNWHLAQLTPSLTCGQGCAPVCAGVRRPRQAAGEPACIDPVYGGGGRYWDRSQQDLTEILLLFSCLRDLPPQLDGRAA
jgi:hypothetical protein